MVNKQSVQAVTEVRGKVPCVAEAQSGSGTGEGGARGPERGMTSSEPLDLVTYLFSHPGRRLDVCFLPILDWRDPCLPDTGTSERSEKYHP